MKGTHGKKRSSALSEERLIGIKAQFKQSGLAIPVPIFAARRLRGLGLRTLKKLEAIGWVTGESELPGLSTRAKNIINNHGDVYGTRYTSKAEVAALLKTAALDRKWRNFGVRTEAEVRRWCGLPPIPAKPARVLVCPHCGKNALAKGRT